MTETSGQTVADRARRNRVAKLGREKSHLEWLAHRHTQEAAHHLARYQAERDAAKAQRAEIAVLDEEIYRLQHPATGVDLTVAAVEEHATQALRLLTEGGRL